MAEQTKPIAESKNFIVLDKYTSEWCAVDHYQSEVELERELIKDLCDQGYEFLPELTSPQVMLANVRERLEDLNGVSFSDDEWARFVVTYLDSPSDGIVDKTRKVHDDYINDFVFDDGRIQNIYLFDKANSDMFAHLMSDGAVDELHRRTAEVLTDVWTSEILALVQGRRTFEDMHRRLHTVIDLISRANAAR